MSGYCAIKSEPGLWTVGRYHGEEWIPYEDLDDPKKAENLVIRLNGGKGPLDERAELRDKFAAQALAGLLASSDYSSTWEGFAEDAYKIADAMLKARGA